MKKIIWTVFLISIFPTILIYYSGCKKTDSPYGIYAPNGLDVPSPTPTPITGSVEVYVVYHNSDQVGVTVQLIQPNGVTLSTTNPATTQPIYNYAPFNPPSLTIGQWKAFVPKQGNFDASIQTFNITGPGQYPVSFDQGSQVLSSSPTSQTYPTSAGNNFIFGVNYNQTGNLNVPVSIIHNSLPSLWAGTPQVFTLSNGGAASVTFTKLGCDSAPITVSFTGADFSGVTTNISPTTVQLDKGYPLPVTLTATTTGFGNGTYRAVFTVTSSNDCGITYNLSTYDSCYSKSFSADDNLTSGQSVTYSFGDGSWNNACSTYTEILTTPYGPITWNSGALTGGNFSGVAINTTY